jgi:hypothetical protein
MINLLIFLSLSFSSKLFLIFISPHLLSLSPLSSLSLSLSLSSSLLLTFDHSQVHSQAVA